MGDIFQVPVVVVEQRSAALEYRISDGDDRDIGAADQAAGQRPRTGFLALFGSGLGKSRLVVRVTDPGGGPLFFVDYQPGAPPAVVGPDGAVVGRMVKDRLGMARNMLPAGGNPLGAVLRTAVGMNPGMRHRLVDAAGRPLCALAWRMRWTGSGQNRRLRPMGCEYLGPNGQRLAHLNVREGGFKDRYELRLMYDLPQPLRTLAVAVPLAFDLTRS